ncbi:MAG: hypothetical protein M3Q33_12140, partial [Acidobacteriota bacterium]|nr:hypothetical protein [Acidobacteriota bacterium]
MSSIKSTKILVSSHILKSLLSKIQNSKHTIIIMLIKNNSKALKVKYALVNLLSLIIFTTVEIWAQMPLVPVPIPEDEIIEEDFTWQYILLFILVLGLVGAIVWVFNNKKNQKNL